MDYVIGVDYVLAITTVLMIIFIANNLIVRFIIRVGIDITRTTEKFLDSLSLSSIMTIGAVLYCFGITFLGWTFVEKIMDLELAIFSHKLKDIYLFACSSDKDPCKIIFGIFGIGFIISFIYTAIMGAATAYGSYKKRQ